MHLSVANSPNLVENTLNDFSIISVQQVDLLDRIIFSVVRLSPACHPGSVPEA
jgi:hypothetical protein